MNLSAFMSTIQFVVFAAAVNASERIYPVRFLSEPDEYVGGELVVEDTYGYHEVKLPAGDMILYPSTSLHEVTPITSGCRIASFLGTKHDQG